MDRVVFEAPVATVDRVVRRAKVTMGQPTSILRKGQSKHSWPRSKPRTSIGSTNPPHCVLRSKRVSSKSQELFKKIFDLNLSESELDELAEELDGIKISAENPPKSTGQSRV